jgi:adenylosuccinate lyase
MTNEWEKGFNGLIERLREMSQAWANVPMLARTHGQPATPTRLGKEIHVFLERLIVQHDQMKHVLLFPSPKQFKSQFQLQIIHSNSLSLRF